MADCCRHGALWCRVAPRPIVADSARPRSKRSMAIQPPPCRLRPNLLRAVWAGSGSCLLWDWTQLPPAPAHNSPRPRPRPRPSSPPCPPCPPSPALPPLPLTRTLAAPAPSITATRADSVFPVSMISSTWVGGHVREWACVGVSEHEKEKCKMCVRVYVCVRAQGAGSGGDAAGAREAGADRQW